MIFGTWKISIHINLFLFWNFIPNFQQRQKLYVGGTQRNSEKRAVSHIWGDSGHRGELKESKHQLILTILADRKSQGEKWSNAKKHLGIHTHEGVGVLPVVGQVSLLSIKNKYLRKQIELETSFPVSTLRKLSYKCVKQRTHDTARSTHLQYMAESKGRNYSRPLLYTLNLVHALPFSLPVWWIY